MLDTNAFYVHKYLEVLSGKTMLLLAIGVKFLSLLFLSKEESRYDLYLVLALMHYPIFYCYLIFQRTIKKLVRLYIWILNFRLWAQ